MIPTFVIIATIIFISLKEILKKFLQKYYKSEIFIYLFIYLFMFFFFGGGGALRVVRKNRHELLAIFCCHNIFHSQVTDEDHWHT